MATDPEKEPLSDKKDQPTPTIPIFSLWRFASNVDLFLVAVGCVLSAGVGAVLPCFFLLLGDLLDNLGQLQNPEYQKTLPADYDPMDEVIPTVLLVIYLGTAQIACGYLCQLCWVLSGENQAMRIRKLYVRSVLRQEMSWFDQSEEGSMTTRLAQDTQLIQQGISENVGMAIQTMSQFLAGFIVAFIKGWRLAIVMLASLPVLGIVGSIMIYFVTKYVGGGQDAYADAGAIAEQVISGIKTVYAFSLQDRFQKRYEKELQKAYNNDVGRGIAIGGGFGGFMFVMFCTYALAFWYGSRLVLDDIMKGSEVMVVFFGMLMGAMGIISMPPNISAISSGRGAAYKIFATIDRVPAIDSQSEKGRRPDNINGELQFTDVSFHYPTRPDVPVLKGLNLKIAKGTTVAFVGPSGSGKSTSIGLVQRFYDPIEGTVSLDGTNLKELNLKWLRQQIGVVGQEPVLFNTTIKQNILLGSKAEVTQGQMIECCKQANCHNFIMALPKQYDTVVGERGGMLSGGQKQRIAIARALIKNPKILLLDEATSALDTASERIVQAALDEISSTRTTIVVAHRLSTIRNADQIVVMKGGVPVEMGKHDDLVALGGVYAELVEKQKIKMQEEEKEDVSLEEAEAREIQEANIKAAEFKPPSAAADDARAAATLPNQVDFGSINSIPRVARDLINEGFTETIVHLEDASTFKARAKESRRQAREEDELMSKSNKAKGVVRKVVMMMKPEWLHLCIGCVAAMVAGCVFPVFGYTLGSVISILLKSKAEIDPGPFKGANLYAFIFVVIGVAAIISIFIQIYMFNRAGASFVSRLRAEAFSALMKQEAGYFDHEDNSMGAVTSRLATDASSVADVVTKVWGDVCQLVSTAIAGLVIAFYHAWDLTLYILTIVPFMVAASMFETRVLRGYENETKKAYEKSGEVAAEAFKEIKTVASLTRENYFLEKYSASIDHPHKLGKRKAYLTSIAHGASQGFNMYANAIGFYAGFSLIFDGSMHPDALMIVTMSVTITAQGLGRSSTFTSSWTKGKIAAIKTFELLYRKTSIDPDKPGDTPLHIDGDFDFKDITFAYPTRPDQEIFKGKFNLSGKRNQTVALVGPSGCGKSTTIGMLERFYDPAGGTVSLSSKDVKSYHLKDGLRKHLSLVGQEPILFDMSIGENILWGSGRETVTEEEIVDAAKMANIHNFIVGLPNGYETSVGKGGSQLSGGQKQRVAIARALIRKPTVLLLDEATSALDSESEKLVQEAIDKAIGEKNRTVITIAHRLSTIQDADLIAVVKDGKVFESGTHFELLELNGVYSDLVKQQSLSVL